MENNERNANRTLIIILIFGILLISTVSYNVYNRSKDIEFNGVTLSQKDYNSIKEVFDEDMIVRVCNINEGNCIRFLDIEKVKKYQESINS